jgi:predicted acylesterase/phospholipase RssA
MLVEINFLKFMDKGKGLRLPVLGKAYGMLKEKGIYSGKYVETWMEEILKAKGIEKFKDVSVKGRSRLKIIAADITRKRMLSLPDDLKDYGYDPMEFSIAKAIRMSTSIPFYFKPVKFEHSSGVSYIVDGAVACNFPISIFDSENTDIPTIGFRFENSRLSYTSEGRTDALAFLFDIAATMTRDTALEYSKPENASRTIVIPTLGVESTDFKLPQSKSLELFKSGYKAAREFCKTWDLNNYNDIYEKDTELA